MNSLLNSMGSLIRQVAPTIATALGGPLAGLATKTLSEALLGNTEGSPDEIAAALSSASPDQLAKLREIDANFRVTMKKLDIDLAQIDASDRDSARKREVELKDKTPMILASVVCAGFFSTLIGLLLYGLPSKGQDAVLILLGALSAAFTAIVNYYYGSSSGSKAKEQIIDQMIGKK
jgi:VIT1/CCC1 family predicted Fe2+/Mn2+ transporter